jgi:hypothetical protein
MNYHENDISNNYYYHYFIGINIVFEFKGSVIVSVASQSSTFFIPSGKSIFSSVSRVRHCERSVAIQFK